MSEETVQNYLLKSKESLASARDDLAKKRFNSCANRAYYACYQAAVAFLTARGVKSRSKDGRWGHDSVQENIALLIKRRKALPEAYRSTLPETLSSRIRADYFEQNVTRREAGRVLKLAENFVSFIEGVLEQ